MFRLEKQLSTCMDSGVTTNLSTMVQCCSSDASGLCCTAGANELVVYERNAHEYGSLYAKEQCDQTIVFEKDGSTYQGELQNGMRHGYGVWISAFGPHPTSDGLNSSCKYGRNYVGQFAEGKFSGSGRMQWHTTTGVIVYDGEYLCDRKHGKGKLLWPDGRMYDGQWQMGKRNGIGQYIDYSGEQRLGRWSDDALIGPIETDSEEFAHHEATP